MIFQDIPKGVKVPILGSPDCSESSDVLKMFYSISNSDTPGFLENWKVLRLWIFLYTVESPNNGHVGGMASVRCRELSAFRRLLTIIIFVAS